VTVAPWWVSSNVEDARKRERIRAEKDEAKLIRTQVRALRRQKRRDLRRAVARWLIQRRVLAFPFGAVAAFTVGFFTVSMIAGFVALGLGLLALEWRVSK
jgi:hypothetical protein